MKELAFKHRAATQAREHTPVPDAFLASLLLQLAGTRRKNENGTGKAPCPSSLNISSRFSSFSFFPAGGARCCHHHRLTSEQEQFLPAPASLRQYTSLCAQTFLDVRRCRTVRNDTLWHCEAGVQRSDVTANVPSRQGQRSRTSSPILSSFSFVLRHIRCSISCLCRARLAARNVGMAADRDQNSTERESRCVKMQRKGHVSGYSRHLRLCDFVRAAQ
jgi:hypothetical protein